MTSKADPSSGEQTHQTRIQAPGSSPLCFLFDTNFSAMCPQETCGSEGVQGCLGRAQGRKERGPLQFRRSSEARSLRPPKNRADGALCRRGQPRRRRTPTPATALACAPRPAPRAPGRSQASADPAARPRQPRGHARVGGGGGGQGRRLRTCPVRGSAPGSGPTGERRPRPSRSRPAPPRPRGLPDAPSDPSRPTPHPFPLRPRVARGPGDTLLSPANRLRLKAVRLARPRKHRSGTELDAWREVARAQCAREAA